MFNFFKKKYKNITEYPNTWGVSQGQIDGKPCIFRYRNIQDAKGHTEYPFQIGVAVPFNVQTENGLPEQTDSMELNTIEDSLVDLLEEGNEAVFVLTITTNNMREFVFYAKEWKPEIFESKIKNLNKTIPTHHLQFMMKQDSTWATFSQFVK